MKRLLLSIALIMHVVAGAIAQMLPPDKGLQNLKWRPVGPANMGGGVTDISGVPGPTSFYDAGADGGIVKTDM
jgi:hypothetical protein